MDQLPSVPDHVNPAINSAVPNGLEDLIDERQLKLFGKLDELKALEVGRGIDTPKLVVIGDQSHGKSSVLEAIARLRLPVDASLCTKFPTKIVLWRSPQERTTLSIEPSNESRNPVRNAQLSQFQESLAGIDTSEFTNSMEKAAAAILGAEASTSSPHSGPTEAKQFADDVFVIKKCGPSLPLVDLIDLPGMFLAEGKEQSAKSAEMVKKMVGKYLRGPRNLILLVVNARSPFVNSSTLALVQHLAKSDPSLLRRVVGVVCGPDVALSTEETKQYLQGEADSMKLVWGWHVVKNQQRAKEGRGCLATRDKEEEQFFGQAEWAGIPDSRKGIQALRLTLKNAFWSLTLSELPGLQYQLERRCADINALLKTLGNPRDTKEARQKYLRSIASRFETLTREACHGRYIDEEFDMICSICDLRHRFFGTIGDADTCPASQKTRLRANIRALSTAFADAMLDYGKTIAIGGPGADDFPESAKSQELVSGQPSRPRRAIPSEDVLRGYYTHDRPQVMTREHFEAWLAPEVERFRGREPIGEASEAVYHGTFERQSRKWPMIAEKHLSAVVEEVRSFVDLALASACAGADPEVLKALKEQIVRPGLDRLKTTSCDTLKQLQSCHTQGNTGFYDVAVELRPMQRYLTTVAQGLGGLTLDSVGLKGPTMSDESFKTVRDSLIGVAMSVATGKSLQGAVIENAIAQGSKIAEAVIPKVAKATAATDAAPSASTQVVQRSETDPTAAARVIDHIEGYYEISMVSFVGYVNALVVERGILQQLPKCVLNIELIQDMDEATITKIAGEKEENAKQRGKHEQGLLILAGVMEAMRDANEQTR
ncbi:hypothetical protein GQ53DRAFT_721521 [Thozetella sp. PMI_491]|nr:hypothetical protein GQ53DRAFT_721521 [Thozetella sp. PMI_491]